MTDAKATGHHVFPFKGRQDSGIYEQNLLWRSGNVFVMDNHRAAAWCWSQAVPSNTKHIVMHIDRHYDALEANLDGSIASLGDRIPNDIESYLNSSIVANGVSCRAVRWDNYIPLHRHFNPSTSFVFAPHRDGDNPKFQIDTHVEIWDLPTNLECWVRKSKDKWIINLDIDYFFCGNEDKVCRFIDNDYIDLMADAIRSLNDDGLIYCVTICLTPDVFTTGWQESGDIATRICDKLGLDFFLPR